MIDNVNHPSHYTSDKSGVECIEITRHRNFNIGNAIKYLWRAGLKDSGVSVKHIEDLQKAVFYITREIENLERDIEDAEDDRDENYSAEWSQKIFDALFDPTVSPEEFDKLAAVKEAHPAGKILVGNEYIENVFDDIIDSGINYDEVIASSVKKYNDSRDEAIAQRDRLAGYITSDGADFRYKISEPVSNGIRVEDCEVVEDESCWDNGPCSVCDEELQSKIVSLYFPFKAEKYADNSKLTDGSDIGGW